MTAVWTRRLCHAAAAGVILLFLSSVARFYHPVTGFTVFIGLPEGHDYEVPALRAMPHADGPHGYDGQFYAQLALEPLLPALEDEGNPELADFRRRFWWTLPLTVVVTLLAMFGHRSGWIDIATQSWVELALSIPIVLWAGWPFFVRGVQSVINRSPNMWTLIGLGTSAAFASRPIDRAIP